MPAPVVCRRRGQSYTCIQVAVGRKYTYYISVNLKIKKVDNREFRRLWEEYTEYPVRRAAELYLSAAQYREMPFKVQEHLERIVTDPVTAYDPALTIHLKEDLQMTTLKKTAPIVKQPTTSKLASTKQAGVKPLAPARAKKAPVKPMTPMEHMANQVTKSATTAEVKKATATGKSKTSVEQPTPPKRGVRANLKPDDRKYTVGDDASVKRGISRDFVDAAKKLKKFTRTDLVEAFKIHADEERAVRYFYYFVGKQVFVAA